jgi:ferritin
MKVVLTHEDVIGTDFTDGNNCALAKKMKELLKDNNIHVVISQIKRGKFTFDPSDELLIGTIKPGFEVTDHIRLLENPNQIFEAEYYEK